MNAKLWILIMKELAHHSSNTNLLPIAIVQWKLPLGIGVIFDTLHWLLWWQPHEHYHHVDIVAWKPSHMDFFDVVKCKYLLKNMFCMLKNISIFFTQMKNAMNFLSCFHSPTRETTFLVINICSMVVIMK